MNKPKTSQDIVFAGVDDGYAMTDIAVQGGALIKIASSARAGVDGITAFAGGASSLDSGYESEGQRFTVTDQIDGEGTRFDEYPFSALNRVIVHHALRVAGLAGKSVKIATGLPVAHYFSGNLPNLPVIERKTQNLLLPVRTLSGEPCANIVEHFVFAEGVAAWVDYCVSDAGKPVVNLGRPAAVVDIGGRTTDTVTVLPGWKVDHARSGTGMVGVLDLYEMISSRVQAKFNIPSVPTQAIEESLRTNKIALWGKMHDIPDIVAAARLEVGGRILREVQRRIGRGHDMEKVLFVGGGAIIFPELKDKFPNADCPPNPEFANARGLLKFMTHAL